jgi:hypothetical protein
MAALGLWWLEAYGDSASCSDLPRILLGIAGFTGGHDEALFGIVEATGGHDEALLGIAKAFVLDAC